MIDWKPIEHAPKGPTPLLLSDGSDVVQSVWEGHRWFPWPWSDPPTHYAHINLPNDPIMGTLYEESGEFWWKCHCDDRNGHYMDIKECLTCHAQNPEFQQHQETCGTCAHLREPFDSDTCCTCTHDHSNWRPPCTP